ncbi:heme ABC transporter substrate-binding protein IsdE [Paenibacillus sp. NPDC057967]|uniref:heme ABC transporter substrate-binding protein IsdE n=1 Tax=Paenibacillus sp. NPDC057967 TaxID=3346293 RepID=UPI0036DCEBA5
MYSRNRLLLLAAALLLALVLCACGAAEGSPAKTAPAAASAPSPQSAETEPTSEEQQRIVATTVAITQIMDALELDLVGIPKSVKELPARYDGITKVGNPMSPDMELVKSLKPTEVLSVTTLKYDLEPVFENVGVDASFLDFTKLSFMQEEISTLGQRFGREQQAEAINKEWDERLNAIRESIGEAEQPTVLILLGVPGSYLVATEHSYIGDLVRLLGGINIVQGEKVEFLASNTEYLQKGNPDVILRAAHGMPEEVVKMFDKEFKTNDIWKHFKAVQTGRVYDLEEALFGTTGNLAVGEALEALVGMLYPDVKR